MLAWLVACHDWCGHGTVERDRVCVSAEPQVVVVTEPAPADPDLVCGPGTVEQDGTCVLEGPVVTCGDGTVLRGDTCVTLAEIDLQLPFAAGTAVTVSQGMHGGYSHTGASEYAIDFPVEVGTEIVAAREGRVVELKEDSDYGCSEPGCAQYGNFLVVDHGDATFGQYWHLELNGALVEIGDRVGRGQVIARSGNTGFSSGPHVHLQVRDPLGQSLPMRFVDQPDGLVYAGGTFTSGNTLEPAPDTLDWSTCPTDLMAYLGVRLDPGLPCAIVDPDTEYTFGGEVLVDGASVLTGRLSVQSDNWDYECSDAPEGRFDEVLQWPSAKYQLRTYLAVAAADPRNCGAYQSWSTSIYLTLGP